MTRDKFLNKLRKKLSALPKAEREEAIQYYREYFDEAGEAREEEIIKELKSPSYIAAKILAQYSQKQSDIKKPAIKNKVKSVWFIILAVLAAPLALPVVLVLGVVLFFLTIIGGGLILLFLLILIMFLISAISVILTNPAILLFGIGALFILYGLINLLIILINKIIIKIQKFFKEL